MSVFDQYARYYDLLYSDKHYAGEAEFVDRLIRRLQAETCEITMIAEPTCHPEENSVTVDYHIFVRQKPSNRYFKIKESHPMRYLFLPEIRRALASATSRSSSPEPGARPNPTLVPTPGMDMCWRR